MFIHPTVVFPKITANVILTGETLEKQVQHYLLDPCSKRCYTVRHEGKKTKGWASDAVKVYPFTPLSSVFLQIPLRTMTDF